jgi:hypothetical protein
LNQRHVYLRNLFAGALAERRGPAVARELALQSAASAGDSELDPWWEYQQVGSASEALAWIRAQVQP